MIDRPHWSYSQLAQYMRCPLQYFFERVLKLPRPFTSSSLVLGSAVHAALAEYHRSLQAGRLVSKEVVRARFLQEWGDRERERPVRYGDGQHRGDCIEQGVALLERYRTEDAPTDIIGVEQSFTVPIVTSRSEILDRPLVAVIDLLHRQNGELVVSELKTSGRKFAESQVDTALQATAYALAIEQTYDRLPLVQYTILVRTTTPQVQRLNTIRQQSDLERFGDVVQSVERALVAQAFYPIESPLNCSSCPFRLPCLDWRGSVAIDQNAVFETQFAEDTSC